MAAMEVFLGTLVGRQPAPLTNSTGGTSISNPNAGYNGSDPTVKFIRPAKKAGKVGAWFLTVVIILVVIWSLWFLNGDAWERKDGKADNGKWPMSEKPRKRTKGKGANRDVMGVGVGVLPKIEEMPRPIYCGGTLPT